MFERLWREPDGWQTGGLWVAIGVAFLGLYGYYAVVGVDGPLPALHFGVLWVVMGIPELLPNDRTRLAGAVRIAGLGFAAVLLAFYLTQLSIFQ